MQRKKILILLDSPKIRREVTTYSVELARRTGAGLQILMLLRWGRSPGKGVDTGDVAAGLQTIRNRGELVLRACVEEIRAGGLQAEGSLRQGDRSSELLKCLAQHQPFEAVVWGGNEAFLRRRRVPIRGHWLERIREQLDCTLVVPSLKGKHTGTG